MITPSAIAKAMKECVAEKILYDAAGERGAGMLMLVMRRYKAGVTASWTARLEVSGKRQKIALGRYPEMGLREARAAFDAKVRAPLLEGRNPVTTAAKHGTATVEALFRAYVTRLQAEAKPSWLNTERVLLTSTPNCADRLGRHRMVGSITPGDVVACLKPWFDAGHRRQADIARTAMQAAFNLGLRAANTYTNADRYDWGLKTNPASAVEKDAAASVARERNLSVAEIRQLWDGLAGDGFRPDTADALRLLLLCGQRVRETLRADGADFDLDAGVWTMPGAKTKGGKPHALPLPGSAVPVVRGLIKRHGAGPLFPARAGAKADRLADTALDHAMSRWCARHAVEPVQPRDLRRTWKSRAGEAGVDRFARDLIQQHAQSDTGSKFYDRADYMPRMREAMARWDLWFTEAVTQ